MAKPAFGFPTTTAAKENAQRILNANEGPNYGVPLTGDDAAFVTLILQNHPSFEEKIGSVDNILHHVVEKDGTGAKKGRGFRTRRKDTNQLIPWSYPTALSGKHRDPLTDLKVAMRWEVQPWIEEQRVEYDEQFGSRCFETMQPVRWEDSDMHHYGEWTFERIFSEFWHSAYVHAAEVDPERVKVVKAGVGLLELADRDLAAAFVAFHAERANMVRVSKEAHKNLSAAATSQRAASGAKTWDLYRARREFGPLDPETQQ